MSEIATEPEPSPAAPADADVASPLPALLSISLGPAFPGNVHVYEITIDLGDGTFAGVAVASSRIPGETISGAFGVGYTTIEFRGVYPVDVYANYLWFGTGPLGGFTGGDSLGNVLDTLSATVTMPADVTDDGTAVVAAPFDDGEWTPVDELLVAMTVAELPQDAVDEAPLSAASVAAALVADAMLDALDVPVREPLAVPVIIEPEAEMPIVVDVTPDVVVTEPEVVPEVEAPVVDEAHDVGVTEPEVASEQSPEVAAVVADHTVEVPPEPVQVHGVGCQCLPCRWAEFNPIPVTEGPFAGKAFYFAATKQVPPDVMPSEPTVTERAAENGTTAAHSQTRGKRRTSAHRARR